MRPLPTPAAACGIVARPEPTHHTATIATNNNNTNSPPFIFLLSKINIYHFILLFIGFFFLLTWAAQREINI
jgi:hypothetical protein